MRTRTKWRWYLHLPGSFYALGPLNEYHATEREARQEAREWLKVDRLPRGAELWKSDHRMVVPC